MAIPIRPSSPSGKPSLSVFLVHVFPPSNVMCIPEPGPPDLKVQGHLRCSHMFAISLFGLLGSITNSAQPVLLSTKRIFSHVAPPSVVLNTPRSGCSPQGDPIAAT